MIEQKPVILQLTVGSPEWEAVLKQLRADTRLDTIEEMKKMEHQWYTTDQALAHIHVTFNTLKKFRDEPDSLIQCSEMGPRDFRWLKSSLDDYMFSKVPKRELHPRSSKLQAA